MINTNEKLKNRIMKRVYFIWFVKSALPYLTLEIAAFAGFMYFVGRQIYVARVLEYSSSVLSANTAHPLIFVSFAFNLFLRTHLGVQLSIIGSLAMIFFLFRNIIDSAVQLTLAKSETELGRYTL